MKFSLISDLHIKSAEDPRYELLLKFINSKEVKNSDTIILLGDIFDLLIGPHLEYLSEYDEFFEKLKQILKEKQVWWFEGNHDFHFKKLMPRFLKKELLEKFSYITEEKIILINEIKIYFAHGDHLDIENTSYMKYKKIVRSNWARFIIENFLPYSGLKFLKEKFSNQSKKMQKSFDKQKEKNKFLRYVSELKGFNLVVLGHSHIFENSDSYINLGFPEVNKKFLYFDGKANLIDLI